MSDPSDWAAPGSGQRPPEQGWGPPPAGGGRREAPKPGVIPLRPLGVAEILDAAIAYIRGNPVVTLGLSAVVITITQLIQLPISRLLVGRLNDLSAGLESGRAPDSEQLTAALGQTLGGAALSGIVAFVGVTVLSGLLIAVLGQAVLGRPMSLKEAWAATRRRIPGLLGLTLLSGLLIVVMLVAGVVPGVLAGVSGASGGAVALITVVGVLVAVCLAIFFGVAWSMITPAYVLEGIPAMSTFRRSYQLVRPQWWRVFGILLLATIIAGIVSFVLALPFGLVATFIDGAPTSGEVPQTSLLSLVISTVGAIIAGTITAPFDAGVRGLLYVDQRIRREAFDMELLRATEAPTSLGPIRPSDGPAHDAGHPPLPGGPDGHPSP